MMRYVVLLLLVLLLEVPVAAASALPIKSSLYSGHPAVESGVGQPPVVSGTFEKPVSFLESLAYSHGRQLTGCVRI